MTKVLIVDDDKLFSHMLAERLTREFAPTQLQVKQAATAESAQSMLQTRNSGFDIALVDHRLGPGINGLALLEWLYHQDLPIDSVLFTGLDEPEIGMHAYEVGAFRYLIKPFDPHELIWIVKALIKKRADNYERNWLTILNQVGAKLQQVTTLADMGQALVEGGVNLGFERVELYKVQRNEKAEVYFQGFKQAGKALIPNFATITVPYAKSTHHRQAYDAKTLKFFNGRNEGSGYMVTELGLPNTPPASGEWVCIPLLHGEECVGTLILDSPEEIKVLRPEERDLLQLFAQQANAAWERALIHEERVFLERTNLIARRIIERTSSDGTPGDLAALLNVMYRELNKLTPTSNFVVALKHNDPEIDAKGWLYYGLHIRDGEVRKAYWRSPDHQGLIRYLIDHEKYPLFLPQTTIGYRQAKAIPGPRERTVKSWIGIPLRVGEQSIGGIFIEDYAKEERWTQEQFALCAAVVNELAHYLQSTWINQQRTQLNEQLGFVQGATEKLLELAREQPDELPEDEWLWHATLTLATARYGFRFNRALLFMLEEGGALLKGRMGIGHLTADAARKSWEQDEKGGIDNFDIYRERLQQGQLTLTTPADQAVRTLAIALHESPAFAKVVWSNGITTVAGKEAMQNLPAAFSNSFGVTDYWLIPIRVGNRSIGLVMLDNFCATEPPPTFALKYLETLLNAAALIRENLRKSHSQEQLLALNRTILTFANQIPLNVTLRKIARAAQLTTGADSIAIYPLQSEMSPGQLDLGNFIWYETTKEGRAPNHESAPSIFMQYVLGTVQSLIVTDIGQPHPSRLHFADDPVVQQKGIRAFVCVPIRDHHRDRVRGLLYLNYRWPHIFDTIEIEQAEAFANLVSMALKSWRELQGLQTEKESREEELYGSLEILQTALQPDVTEIQLVTILLRNIKDLFKSYTPQNNLKISLFLQDWKRSNDSSADPVEMYRQYVLNREEIALEKECLQLDSLSAKTYQEARAIRVGNTSSPHWFDACKDRHAHPCSEINVPIVGEDSISIGVLKIESSQMHYFTENHARMLQRLTRVTFLALDSIRRRKYLNALLLSGQAITVQRDLQDTLRVIATELLRIVPNLSIMTVWYVDLTDNTPSCKLGAHIGIRHEEQLVLEHPRPDGAIRAIMEHKKPLWAEDVADHAFFANSNFILREEVCSTAAFPLIVADEIIGVIFYAYRQPHRFTKAERELLPILTQYIAIGIHDAELTDKAGIEKKRLQSALRVTEAVGAMLDLPQIVKNTRDVLRGLYPDARSLFLLYNQEKNTLDIMDDPENPYLINNPRYKDLTAIPLNEQSLLGQLALLAQQEKKQQCKLYRDLRSPDAQPYLHLRSEAHSALAIAYVNTKGELLGGLLLESDTINAFSEDDLPLIEGIARQLAFAVERSQQSAALDFRNIITDSMLWATDLAHDLNREIYYIHSWLQSLNDEKATLTETAQSALAGIEASFDSIVRDAPWSLQRVSQIEDLAQLVERWVHEFIGAYASQIEVGWVTAPQTVQVEIDMSALRRVMRHLVHNALRVMRYKGKLTLELTCLANEQILIQLTDTGPGIQNDDPIRQRIFREPISEHGRKGLGLMFARLFIEKLSGHLHLKDFAPDQGATFCIYLPMKPPQNKKEKG